MYIYSKCTKICIFGGLSYGNPMGIIWVSYGPPPFLSFCSLWIVCDKSLLLLQYVIYLLFKLADSQVDFATVDKITFCGAKFHKKNDMCK